MVIGTICTNDSPEPWDPESLDEKGIEEEMSSGPRLCIWPLGLVQDFGPSQHGRDTCTLPMGRKSLYQSHIAIFNVATRMKDAQNEQRNARIGPPKI